MNLFLVVRHANDTEPRQWESFGPFDTLEQLDATARRWRNVFATECYLQHEADGTREFYSHREAGNRQRETA